MSDNENALREKNYATVEYYFAVPHNSPEQLALYAPDATWEQPYFVPGQINEMFPAEPEEGAAPPPLPEGFEVPEFTPEWHWGPTTIWSTGDPNYFFAENSGYGKQLIGDNTLQDYQNHYFHTFQFNADGKIQHYREIANPLNLMKTMKVPFQPLPQPDETIGQLIELYLKEHPDKA